MRNSRALIGVIVKYIWLAVASPFYIGDFVFETMDFFDLSHEWKDWFHTIAQSYSAEECATLILRGASLMMITTLAVLIGAFFISLVLTVLALVVWTIVEVPLIGWILGSFFIVPTVLVVVRKTSSEIKEKVWTKQ